MVPAHRIIPGILAQVVRPAPLCPEKVDFAWRASVGPVVNRATAVRLDGQGVLHVSAQDAQWRREVERSLGLIRSRLDTLLGPDVIIRVEITCHG
jgi:Dna[CI] antecedent, DciA